MFPVVQIAENVFFKKKSERITITASHSSESSSPRPVTPVIQYENITPSDELSENEISEDENSEGTVDQVLVQNPRGLCPCDMVSFWKKH